MSLIEKIRKKKARPAVIGLGYVGLPLAVEFAGAGFDTVGIDIDTEKIAKINGGESYVGDVASGLLSDVVGGGRLRATRWIINTSPKGRSQSTLPSGRLWTERGSYGPVFAKQPLAVKTARPDSCTAGKGKT